MSMAPLGRAVAAILCLAAVAPLRAQDDSNSDQFFSQAQIHALMRRAAEQKQLNADNEMRRGPRGAAPGLEAAPVKLKTLFYKLEPLTITVPFTLEPLVNCRNSGTADRSNVRNLRFQDEVAQALTQAGLPVKRVELQDDCAGSVSFQSSPLADGLGQFGEIRTEVFPGPAVRGSLHAPRRVLLDRILGAVFMCRPEPGVGPTSVHLGQTAKFSGHLSVPAAQFTAENHRSERVRLSFWSSAFVGSGDGAADPLSSLIQNVKVPVGPVTLSLEEGAALDFEGLHLSPTKISAKPLGIELPESLSTYELAPAPPKTPDGGILVDVVTVGQPLSADGSPLGPVQGPTHFFNGAGAKEGESNSDTSAAHRDRFKQVFGVSGVYSEAQAGRSSFCDGRFAAASTPPWGSQPVLSHDYLVPKSAESLAVSVAALNMDVSLSLSRADLERAAGSMSADSAAELSFYLCATPLSADQRP